MFIIHTFQTMLALTVYQEVCRLIVSSLHIYHANYKYVPTISYQFGIWRVDALNLCINGLRTYRQHVHDVRTRINSSQS